MKISKKNACPIAEQFESLPDPRIDRQKLHSLQDMLVIAICGVICGADNWVAIELFGKSKADWFRTFLDLGNGIPSHDTFGRTFAKLNPKAFADCFARWIKKVAELTEGEVVAIDGKTLRRSFDRASSRAAIHMVSAWASENRLVLGQVKTAEKSNEITAIPELLKLLELKGCIVTIDAMGCQKEIAAQIVDQKADYVLAVKGNQPTLHNDLIHYFEGVEETTADNSPYPYSETIDTDHGRIEVRRYWCTDDIASLKRKHAWTGLRSIGMARAERFANGKISVERRYYINSVAGDDAEVFAHAVRAHWGIENSLHWVLDVAFREDESRVRKDHGPANFATLRHIAVNLLKHENTLL